MNNEESPNWDEVIREANELPAEYMRESFGAQADYYLSLAMNSTDPVARRYYLDLSVSFTEAAFQEMGKEEAA